MLRITTQTKRTKITLDVEGRLAGAAVATVEQCWRELRAASPEKKLVVNLCGVSFIDNRGKVLLKEIHLQGGRLLAEGCLNQAIVSEIIERKKKGNRADNKGGAIIFYLALLSLPLLPTRASAQDQPQKTVSEQNTVRTENAPLHFTLDQAVALALKQNTTSRIAVINAAISEQDKNIARADLLPQANLKVSDEAQRVNIRAQFGGKTPFPGFPQHLGPYQVFSAGPAFGAPIFDLTLWKRYQAARYTAEANKASSLSTREQVVLLVVSQYLGTLRATANVVASRSRVDLAQALYGQADDLQKQGVGTGIDTLRANVELQNEKQRLIQSETEKNTSLFALSRLLNLNPRQELVLDDSLSFFDTPQVDVQASIDQALEAREEWKSLNLQVKAAEARKRAAWDSRLPSLRFDGNWAYLGTSSANGIPTYTYQASVNMPLFTGGRIHAQVVQASLEIESLKQQQADLRNGIALDVKTALLNLESARHEVEVANLGVQLAREEVDQARDRFKAGVANNIEVVQAQDALSRASDNQIAALYRFNQARADYARGIGQMEKVYAK
ncbi:MAG TPA: TolC family protein [Candidatus Dormibacteraeota bacterium]|nr:TolC family protein [Candidatus Dormibacteraeota bacterium]